jgi:hypothetical protein
MIDSSLGSQPINNQKEPSRLRFLRYSLPKKRILRKYQQPYIIALFSNKVNEIARQGLKEGISKQKTAGICPNGSPILF